MLGKNGSIIRTQQKKNIRKLSCPPWDFKKFKKCRPVLWRKGYWVQSLVDWDCRVVTNTWLPHFSSLTFYIKNWESTLFLKHKIICSTLNCFCLSLEQRSIKISFTKMHSNFIAAESVPRYYFFLFFLFWFVRRKLLCSKFL